MIRWGADRARGRQGRARRLPRRPLSAAARRDGLPLPAGCCRSSRSCSSAPAPALWSTRSCGCGCWRWSSASRSTRPAPCSRASWAASRSAATPPAGSPGGCASPLRAFGIVEIGVGLSALATPLLLERDQEPLGRAAAVAALLAAVPDRRAVRRGVRRAHRADDADGRDAADRDAVGAGAAIRRSAAASACSMRSTPPARSSAR